MDPDPDPLVRGTVRIRGSGSGSAPKCLGSPALVKANQSSGSNEYESCFSHLLRNPIHCLRKPPALIYGLRRKISGSRILIFFHPGSNSNKTGEKDNQLWYILNGKDMSQLTKNLNIFYPQIWTKLSDLYGLDRGSGKNLPGSGFRRQKRYKNKQVM